MSTSEFFSSKLFKLIFSFCVAIIVLIFVFRAGEIVGFRKAQFSFKWSAGYHEMFAGPKKGWFDRMNRDEFISPHGMTGEVISFNENILVIKDDNHVERLILLTPKSQIRFLNQDVSSSELKADQRVVILGVPLPDGRVEARFIRVFNK